MKKGRPDNVVYNEVIEDYDAKLKPFGTNVGAPSINATDTSSWHQVNTYKFNQGFTNRMGLLKRKYDELAEEFRVNQLIYSLKFNFEPVIGKTYYLYKKDRSKRYFLSIISPLEWGKTAKGAFKLNDEGCWVRFKGDFT